LQTSSKMSSNKLLFQRILLAGVVAGALDAALAIINYYVASGKNPVRIFVFIASGDGKFVHILDPENNKIELWEPVDVEFEKIASAVTK
jgi:hypothetical protein